MHNGINRMLIISGPKTILNLNVLHRSIFSNLDLQYEKKEGLVRVGEKYVGVNKEVICPKYDSIKIFFSLMNCFVTESILMFRSKDPL